MIMNINDIPYEDRIYAYVVEGVTDEDKLKKPDVNMS